MGRRSRPGRASDEKDGLKSWPIGEGNRPLVEGGTCVVLNTGGEGEGGVLQKKDHPNNARDEAGVFSVHADVAQVKAGREEFMLLFGAVQKEQPIQGEVKADLLDQVVLSPFAAKRLLGKLTQVIRDHESAYGPLTRHPPLQDRAVPAGRLPAFKSSVTHEKVGLLFQLLNDLRLRVAFERSFKVSEKSLNGSRFLLGINKHTISRSRHNSILDVCTKLGMPEDFQETFRENLREANVFGFGMDENQETCVVKAYLEFGSRYAKAMKKAFHERDPYVSHLGFKWDAVDNTRCALTKYTCFPALNLQDMLERLSSGFYGSTHSDLYPLIERLLRFVSSKDGEDKFIYLEVNEENNPRSSFDLNVYSANTRMQEVYPLLVPLCRHYSIPDEVFQDLYEPVKDMIFGHLAGGIGRKGNDFLTVYFGT